MRGGQLGSSRRLGSRLGSSRRHRLIWGLGLWVVSIALHGKRMMSRKRNARLDLGYVVCFSLRRRRRETANTVKHININRDSTKLSPLKMYSMQQTLH